MGTYSKEKRRKAGWSLLIILSLITCGMCGCGKADTDQGERIEDSMASEVGTENAANPQTEEDDNNAANPQTEEDDNNAANPQTEGNIPYDRLENCIYMWDDEEKEELLQGYVSLIDNKESKNYKYKDSDIRLLEAKSSYPSVEDQNHESLQKALEAENRKLKDSFEKQVQEALEWAESDVQGGDDTNQELNAIAPYDFDLSWRVIRNDDKMLTIVYSLYSFAGGAHPNLIKWVVSFYPDTGEKIQVKSITDDVEGLKKIIVQELNAFVKDNECELYLFGNEVYKENFEHWDTNWWVQNGILFVGFNTYDIAPYVAGPLVIPVPLSKIETYLNAYGKSLQD